MRFAGALGALLVSAFAASGQPVCSECHQAIAQSFRSTGMGRSFFRPASGNRIEDYATSNYYHSASDTHFEMIDRAGKYFQRQYQIGVDGKQINISETVVDYVMGSGNHARTYLHRTPANELLELPLGWYAEKGGYWAMNPGYDRPDHAGLSRSIPDGCMFCHNGYPVVPRGKGPRANPVFTSVPEGIDCQRCHGDGAAHVALALAPGSRVEDVRGAIVNPANLTAERGMEVCLQCHLEPKSLSTSSLMVRYEREPFSYKPDEALSDFRLSFDQRDENKDRFEIVGSSAWRMMQSQCFLKSNGALTCTTCHDPHREVPAPQQAAHYSKVCNGCHAAVSRHSENPDCVACHMPKRRTQDAIHVVMTDHLIARKPPGRDLLSPLREETGSDGGSPKPYYPSTLPNAADDLYLGVAQVSDKNSRSDGIAHLAAAIAKFDPAAAEYYLQLGDALRASRRFDEAIAPYEEAVRREPDSAAAHDRLAFGLTRVRQFVRADKEFGEALRLAPRDAAIQKDVGIAYLEQGRMKEAALAFERALEIDPALHEAHNGLGGARMKIGDSAGAEAAFREAIRLRPHYVEAHHNLAFLLSTTGRFEDAGYQFEESLRINANQPETRYDYAAMLAQENLTEKAQQQVEAVLRIDMRHIRAIDLLGRIFEAQGRRTEAIEQFRRAVGIDPAFGRGNLDLGSALVRSGQATEARQYLDKAAISSDAAVRAEAHRLLETVR